MKNLLIALCTLSIMVVACKKENKTVTPTTPTTPTTTYIRKKIIYILPM